MDPNRHNNLQLRPRDFQFSLKRMFVATTLCAVLVSLATALKMPLSTDWTGWAVLALVVFVVLYGNWGPQYATNGRLALHAGDYRQALASFDRAIQANPEDPELYYLRADVHSSLQDLEAAINDYSKAIELDCGFVPAWISRANVRRWREEFQEAIDDASIGLCLAPSGLDWVGFRVIGLVVRGSCYRALGRIDESAEEFDEAVRIAPDRRETYALCGSAHLELKQYHLAINDFDEAIKRGTKDHCTLFERALTLFNLGRYRAAMSQIEACLDAYPLNRNVMCIHAQFLATCPDDAIRDGKRALDLAITARGPGTESNWLCESILAAAHAELGRFEVAIEHALKSVELAPLAHRQDLEKALAVYKERQPYRHQVSDSTD